MSCSSSSPIKGHNILDKSTKGCYSFSVMRNETELKTLQQAVIYFSDQDNCLEYMKAERWPNGIVVCPSCGRNDVVFLKNQRKWQCKSVHPKRQFSIKVGTIFEDSPIGLDKWLCAVWMIANCKNGISSYEVSRALAVTQKTAWFMLHRIRLAMQNSSFMKMGGKGGPVEVDETYIGGKARNMHFEKKIRMLGGGVGTVGKVEVIAH
jgi:transposase-like protein